MNVDKIFGEATTFNLGVTSATVTGYGSSVDISSIEDSLAVILSTTAPTGSNPTLDVTLQESSDNSIFTDVSGFAFTQITTSASVQKKTIQKNKLKQYLRPKFTLGGSSPSYGSIHVIGLGVAKYK